MIRFSLAVLLPVVLMLLPPTPIEAAETAETILIRTALSKDLAGRRRGDADLVVDAYDEERLVVYNGGGSASAAAWTPLFNDRDAYVDQIAEQLRLNRYDINREVVFMQVWGDKAFVTTTDSGFVIHRESEISTPLHERRLWTLNKQDDEWLVTGLVADYGDTTDGAVPTGIANEQVANVLREEAAAWSKGSVSGVVGHVDDEFVAIESFFSANPAKWLIIFGDRDEYRLWLDERLDRVDYTVKREILHVAVGAKGQEAVAVTRDQIRAEPIAGDAIHEQERLSHWLLTRQGGDWAISWVFWKAADIPLAGSTAVLH